MSVRRIKAGTTDVSVTLRIVDSTDGTPETGVVFNTAGIDLWYRRDGATSTDITEATLSALNDAHSDGGFLHINDGWYRLDLPDAACATGVAGVQIGGTVTGMVVFGPYIELPANTDADIIGELANGTYGLSAIESLVDDIGAAGAGLTAADDAIIAALALMDAKLDTIDNFLDTEVAAILEDTGTTIPALIGTPAADVSADIAALLTAINTIDDFLDTEVAAIKAKTDQLTFGTANRVNAQVYGMENGTITAAAHAAGAVDAAALAADAGTELADALLNRNMATGTDSGSETVRTVRQALRALRNKVGIAAGTMTVTKEDDTTASWTAAVTTAAGDPISEIDPASS